MKIEISEIVRATNLDDVMEIREAKLRVVAWARTRSLAVGVGCPPCHRAVRVPEKGTFSAQDWRGLQGQD